ncbi:FliM/FliN family flagellar motor switch protein [bacterium]|nr:FliM/FliN family flagellar motor switch protein [bacterium]
MNTNGVEKLNNKEEKTNLFKTYNWIDNSFSVIFDEAIKEFWEIGIDNKLIEVSDKQGFFYSGSEYFVTRIALAKEHQFIVRLSKEAVQVLLDMTISYNQNFVFENITELEARILTAFSNFIYEKFSQKMLSDSEITEEHGEYYLTYLLKDLGEIPVKVVITIPKACLNPEEVKAPYERYNIEDFPNVRTSADFYIGSTSLPLNDVKNIEKEDIIVLENSNINNMTMYFEGEKIGFKVSPDPALIISFDNEEGNKAMGKSNNIWDNIMVDISAEFEGVKIPLGEIKQISEGLVVDMGSLYDNKVYLKVENKVIAEGELVIINDRYGVKVDKLTDDKNPPPPIPEEEEEKIAPPEEEEEENIEENNEEEFSEEENTNDEEFDYKDFDVDDENI